VKSTEEGAMKSPTLALMEEAGVEPTRRNFLNLAYLGNEPERLDPEEEAELPRPLQDWYRVEDLIESGF